MWLVFGWASNLLAIWVASRIFDGVTYDGEFLVLAVAALVFVFVNAIVRPFVIVLMLYFTDLIVPPFEVRGFWTTFGAALIIWLVNMVVHGVFKPEREQQ